LRRAAIQYPGDRQYRGASISGLSGRFDATERDMAIGSLVRDSIFFRNVRRALRDIEESNFGMCLHCEEEISPKRLAAVPWTPFCIQWIPVRIRRTRTIR
jgi:RNA polymerase-binding transcription factor DksA